jgi:hypothetical protein
VQRPPLDYGLQRAPLRNWRSSRLIAELLGLTNDLRVGVTNEVPSALIQKMSGSHQPNSVTDGSPSPTIVSISATLLLQACVLQIKTDRRPWKLRVLPIATR